MISANDIFNKNIITVKEGRQINKIDEIYIDKKRFVVKGFLISNLEKFLNFSDVTSISETNLVINTDEKLLDFNTIDKSDLIEYTKIKKLKIISEKGLDAGKIQTLFFKKDTGEITHYEIAETPISEHKILSQDGILSLGEDAIMVKEEAIEISDLMKSKTGFINFIKNLFFKTKKGSEKAKEKTKQTINNVKPKAKEYIDKIKNIIKKKEKN